MAAEEALAGGVWSSPIVASPTSFASDGEQHQTRGELSELVDHFENLSQRDRRALLAQARRLRFGKR